ncbi:unnamed protein product (macronuclear) [Paramecium tetraurelia]|uniref:Uncharacterized protein n=1 Tax=Paramecium tetraurelia TaxID=5888 RepID=A0CPC0_PARTE|nr:uncharacterized protein GSPATT00009028001 [Paramecium tetraurelia]CAK72637.1 unnamed protein product [Paramecium tetraurelia]|eukprot:XP_001440034.1 hypothetical protein (macronuclear) [Paramecium tetraurelia strain d4-2]
MHSTPKCQLKQEAGLEKIHNRTIKKQQKQTLQTKKKSEQSIILAYQNNRKLRQQTYEITHNKYLDQSCGSIQNILIPLGRLQIDEFTINNKILERKITPEFVECKLSSTNSCEEENELKKNNSFYQYELLQLYNSLPVLAQQQNERKRYEDSLNLPYECITLQFHNNKLIKIQKKWNYDFLRMMGINQEIIDDYIFNHNLLPKCWDLNKIYQIIGESRFATNIKNYQGKEFISNVDIKIFTEQNKSTSIKEQVIYFSFKCERQFLSVEQIETNFQHYFKLDQIASDCQMSIHRSRITKRCSIRQKAN